MRCSPLIQRTVPELARQVDELEARVAGHLAKMGFAWM